MGWLTGIQQGIGQAAQQIAAAATTPPPQAWLAGIEQGTGQVARQIAAAITTQPPTTTNKSSFIAGAAAITTQPPTTTNKSSFIAGAAAMTTQPPTTTSLGSFIAGAAAMTTKPPTTTSLGSFIAGAATQPPTTTNKSFSMDSFKVGNDNVNIHVIENTIQVDPTRTEPPVNTTLAPTHAQLTCSTYDVNDYSTLYDVLNDTNPSMYGFMLDCLQKNIIEKDRQLHDLVTSQEADKKDAITASEMNRGMRAIYQNDLFFTISKVFMFIILICAYIYFLKYTGIIQPIKDGAKIVKDNLEKVKDIKMPKIKMPEVTMPSIKMPTK